MKLRYEEEMEKLEQCPPCATSQEGLTAFRFVFETIDKSSFEPVAMKSPARELRNGVLASETCDCWGLSLFSDKKCAEKKLNSLLKMNSLLAKAIGSRVAEGIIKPEDGIHTVPDRHGHFTLFESDQCDLTMTFEKVVWQWNS